LVDRLASAVSQRLAARIQGTNIDKLASLVADRLAASSAAERLVASAATHVGGRGWTSLDLEKVASRTAFELSLKKKDASQ